MRFILSLCLVITGVNTLVSQSNIPIGSWRSYLPHNLVHNVEQSPEKIIYATEQSIFTIDKEDMTVDYLSKVEGLTDTGIETLVYDEYNEAVIIAYENSILDIIQGNSVFPIFDIYNNNNFNDRKINDIFIQNREWMYLATGFGVVQYNLQSREFGFTLNAGQAVNQIEGDEDFIFIATESDIYYLDYNNASLPNAFSSWQKLSDGLPQGEEIDAMLFNGDGLYISVDKDILISQNFEAFESFYTIESDERIVFLDAFDNKPVAGIKDNSASSRIVFFDEANIPIDEITTCTNRLLDMVVDERGRVFFADEWLYVRFIDENGNCKQNSYYGPFNFEATDFSIKDDIVYVASGGITDNFQDRFSRDGFYILEEGEWTNINQEENSFFRDNDIIQFYRIAAHPSEDKVFVGSFWAGLLEYNLETGEQILYTPENTNGALNPAAGDEQRTRISGLYFDDQENLWISSYLGARPLSVYTSEKTWHSFDLPGDDKLSDLVVDDIGNVWAVIAGTSGGVVVYNPGDNIKDPTDDPNPRLFNVNNSEIPSSVVNSIAKDLDGGIWVGTAQGVVLFECGSAVFEDVCEGDRPIVFQDNVGAYLLESENVTAIAVDGANRKWFGTGSGIFVQSPNGEEQIAHFNIDNSPLFDNSIVALEYNENTGEMFISTDRGFQSYRTETTGARPTHGRNVYAFPNPVRPEFAGDIAIKGLARDAEVKITDIDGQLVFQTEALGGQAVWDGRDRMGREVSAGVYLVFSSSSDTFLNPDTAVAKILIIR